MKTHIILQLFALVCIGCSSTARFSSVPSSDADASGAASRTDKAASKETHTGTPERVRSSLYDLTVPKKKQPLFRQTGTASYYARKFHGRRTASGERHDMKDFTAAHRKLPFGTRLKVTNLANGKSVIVRVNDRGPHTKKRIIDLSYAAARNIGLLKQGIAKVVIEVVD
ncbi:MAG: septal ring lytic transglycosylase RlpA family protein [Chitinispirillaceae bacterium]|nr:septal ring lytic transglycosylase RlpA family protein [Chitinispirillaceae bacterium]